MNTHYVAYTQACMFQRAFECAYGNAWGKGAKHNFADLIDMTEYFKKVMEHGKEKKAQPLTKEEVEAENRRLMFEQSEWLKERNGR